jgi:uncharacterized protein (DUF302 family)
MPTSLGFTVTLHVAFEPAMERTRAALKAEGFGILSEIDIQAAFKEKLGREFRRYPILGACNPPLAWDALAANAEVGLLLPCNVTVEQGEGDTTIVRLIDPIQMLAQAGGAANPAIEAVAQEARVRLERVAEALGAG